MAKVAASKTKRVAGHKSKARSKPKGYSAPYDAKKYAGSVPAFASVVAEEMQAWRADR